MKITTSTLMRLAGLSSSVAGLSFVVVGLFHQLNVSASVVTATWVNVHIVAVFMCFFGLLGITGLYVRQVETAGWTGFIGYTLLCFWFAVVMCFSFVEAFVLPTLAMETPKYVESFLAMFSGGQSSVNLSILPVLWNLSGPAFILGQFLFGIATFRARIFPRYAGLVFASGAIITVLGAFIPAEKQPLILVPVGVALTWLGYTLWSERIS